MPDSDPLAKDVRIARGQLIVELIDGRRVAAPLSWFPRLSSARASERRGWRLIAGGRGIHWPALDEDLSVVGLLRGIGAPAAKARRRAHAGSKGPAVPWNLTQAQRVVFLLHLEGGLTVAEIAERLHVESPVARNLLKQAVGKLAKSAG